MNKIYDNSGFITTDLRLLALAKQKIEAKLDIKTSDPEHYQGVPPKELTSKNQEVE